VIGLQAYVRSIIIVLMCGEFAVGVKAVLVPQEGCSSTVKAWSECRRSVVRAPSRCGRHVGHVWKFRRHDDMI